MKSMTGFGYREYQDETIQLSITLKSYNNKYLDIFATVPQSCGQLEPEIREYLNERIARGRVECYLQIRELKETVDIQLDRDAVAMYVKTLREIVDIAGLSEEIHLSHLLRMDGLFRQNRLRDIDQIRARVFPVLEETFAAYEESRKLEGVKTRADIEKQLSTIGDAVNLIEEKAGEMEATFMETLRERFREVCGNVVDEQRVLTETAVLLVKYTINEEIVRMKSHLGQFGSAIAAEGPVGKGLDFLCQELGREINTIGSKSVLLEINQKVLQVKEALERIREQVRNVE